MDQKRLNLLKQLHRTYGSRIDSIINSNPDSPIYPRTCHTDRINQIRRRFLH